MSTEELEINNDLNDIIASDQKVKIKYLACANDVKNEMRHLNLDGTSLKIFQLNAESMQKMERSNNITTYIHAIDTSFDVIVITETWLKRKCEKFQSILVGRI